MPPRTDIQLDFNNMMTETIGEEGLSPSEIDSVQPGLEQIHRGHEDLRRLGQLPFRDLPYQEDLLERVLRRAKEIRGRYRRVLLLGTGGSSLGAECLLQALAPEIGQKGLKVEILEDLHERTWARLIRELPPTKTFLIVVSKSGKTTETLAAFLFFRKWMIEKVGEVGYRKSALFITDPRQGPLREIAEKEKIETMPVPPGVGGRFSVLSTVGILPAACGGVDVKSLLAGARRMDERLRFANPWTNPAVASAVIHHLFEKERGRRVRVVMPYDDRLRAYSAWFAQLWAESLGKSISLSGEEIRSGSTPVGVVGSVGQHSQLQLYLEGPRDKTVTFLAVGGSSPVLRIPAAYSSRPELALLGKRRVHDLLTIQRHATEAALTRSGCPNLTIGMKELNPFTMGQLLYLAEVETVIAGALADINPFDQPGVETIKNFVKGLLGDKGFEDYRQVIEGAKRDSRYVI